MAMPLAASAAAIVINLDPSAWLALPAATRAALAPDALLYLALGVLIGAPIAGVGAARDGSGRIAATIAALAIATVLFVLSSVTVAVFVWGLDQGAGWPFVVTSHTTFGAVALALSAWGAGCGAAFRDSLDAAGCSLLVTLTAAFAVLVGGAAVADLARPLIEAALTASPLVVMAAAAQIDIVRLDLPYQISPLSHMAVQYPSWSAASGWYLALAGVCFAGYTWKRSGVARHDHEVKEL